MRISLSIVTFLLSLQLFAQTDSKVDSLALLQTELNLTQNHSKRIEILCRLAYLSLAQKPIPKTTEALKYTSEALALQEDTTITKNNIAIYLLWEEALQKTNNVEKVADNSIKIAKYYENTNNIDQQIKYLTLSGQTYQQLGNFEKAIKFYYECANTEQKRNNTIGELEALNLVGGILRIERKFKETFALTFGNLERTKKLNEAMPKKSKQKKRSLLLLAENYNLLGAAHYWLANYDSALFYFQKSYPLRLETEDSTAIAKSMNNIALIYRKKANYQKALPYFLESMKILALKDSVLAIPSFSNLGFTYSLMGDNENALKYLNLALNVSISKQVAPRLLESYDDLVEHYIRVKDYEKAFEYESKASTLKDSLFDDNSAKQTASMQALYETNQHKQAVQLHKLESENKTNGIYFILVALLLSLIAVGIFYSRFVLKKRSNDLLQQQYTEINQQKEELDAQRSYIEEQNKTLTRHNANILSSIAYAKRIQNAVLPPIDDISKALPNSFVLFMPKDVVSGDFYWFAEGKDEKTGDLYHIIAAVDCTGHGVPGAFMSLIGNNLLDEIVHIFNILSPELILLELDKGVRKLLKQHEETAQKDGMDLMICSFNSTENILSFAGAMNCLLTIMDNKATMYKGDRFPIGGTYLDIESKKFTKYTINLSQYKEKSYFYLFTDGFQDQFGGKERKKFMLKNFKNLLINIHSESFETQKQTLKTTIEEWREAGNEQQIDDILVIGFSL